VRSLKGPRTIDLRMSALSLVEPPARFHARAIHTPSPRQPPPQPPRPPQLLPGFQPGEVVGGESSRWRGGGGGGGGGKWHSGRVAQWQSDSVPKFLPRFPTGEVASLRAGGGSSDPPPRPAPPPPRPTSAPRSLRRFPSTAAPPPNPRPVQPPFHPRAGLSEAPNEGRFTHLSLPAGQPESKVARLCSPGDEPEPPAGLPRTKDVRLCSPADEPEPPEALPRTKDARLCSPADEPETPAALPRTKVARLCSPGDEPEAPAALPGTKVARLFSPADEPETSADPPEPPAAAPDPAAAMPRPTATHPRTLAHRVFLAPAAKIRQSARPTAAKPPESCRLSSKPLIDPPPFPTGEVRGGESSRRRGRWGTR